MDILISFIMEKLVGWIIKGKNLSKGCKSVIVFLILNLPTAALVAFGCLDLATTKVGFSIFAFILSALWILITTIAVIRGHKNNWDI